MQLEDRFYKSTEVADLLGVSLRTLYRYMENGKIQSVHLPSGRHRFTKQQLEEFLYSNSFTGFEDSSNYSPRPSANNNASQGANAYQQREVKPLQYQNQNNTNAYTPQSSSTPVDNKVVMPSDEELDRQLDDLLKSLEENDSTTAIPSSKDINFDSSVTKQTDNSFLAPVLPTTNTAPIQPNKYEEDDELDALLKSLQNDDDLEDFKTEPQATSNTSQQKNFGISEPISSSNDSDLFNGFRIKPGDATFNENEINYFYCPHSDLRTIAKIIKKVGDDHGLKYAFTLNAGASLFFPLDPFSLIHFYVHNNDLDIWKRELQLTVSNQSEANIGILLTKGNAFSELSEVSGLKVVGKQKLIENLKQQGSNDLALEVEKRL